MAGMYEILNELEAEIAGESSYESSYEADREADRFFGAIAKLAKRAASSPALRKVAGQAARGALQGGMSALQGLLSEHECEGECEFSHETSFESSFESAFESSFEDEGVFESSFEFNPETAQEMQVEAIMEHLGHQAALAETEEEAFAFLAPLLPLAAKAIGGLAAKALPVAAKGLAKVGGSLLKKAAPHVLRGVKGMAKNLFRNPQTRPLLRAVPKIVRNTAQQVIKQAAAGKPVSPQMAVRALAKQAQKTLASPQQLTRTYRRSKAFDRRMHAAAPVAPVEPTEPDLTGVDDGVDIGDEFLNVCPSCGR